MKLGRDENLLGRESKVPELQVVAPAATEQGFGSPENCA
jgi:hypothetical protein